MLDQFVRHGTKMPPVLEPQLKPWVDRVFTFKGKDVRHYGAVVTAEQQLAITKDFAKCEWFGRDAWYRAKVDVMWRLGPVGGVVDWKTGNGRRQRAADARCGDVRSCTIPSCR
jgi:hypothetical protein